MMPNPISCNTCLLVTSCTTCFLNKLYMCYVCTVAVRTYVWHVCGCIKHMLYIHIMEIGLCGTAVHLPASIIHTFVPTYLLYHLQVLQNAKNVHSVKPLSLQCWPVFKFTLCYLIIAAVLNTVFLLGL